MTQLIGIETEESKELGVKIIEEEFKDYFYKFVYNKLDSTDYENYFPLGDEVLVEIFSFIPSKKSEELLGTKHIMVKTKHGEWKPSVVANSEKILPLVRVIRIGNGVTNPRIAVGQVYTVSPDEVLSEEWNPDFLHLANTFARAPGSQGKLVNVPDEMPQKLPALDKNWQKYRFVKADTMEDRSEKDRYIYLIPTLKLKTLYKQ